MKKYMAIALGVLLSIGCLSAQNRIEGLKPQWLRIKPVCKSDPNVLFVPVTIWLPAPDMEDQVRRSIYNALPVGWSQEVTYLGNQSQELTPAIQNGKVVKGGKATIVSDSIMTAEGNLIRYKSMKVDEYSGKRNGQSVYSAIYQVVPDDGTELKACYVTDRYGASAACLSIVPGIGQFYKGDMLKGSLFMGGCVLGGVGVVFTEMQRQAYLSQISQTHDINVIRQLDANRKNMGIARNVCIGVTAALYVWNIFDAAVAPGARRIRITDRGIQYNF
mgnify:FL=1